MAALLALGVTAALVLGVLMLPEPVPTLAPLVVPNLPATGVANPITGVLLAFRALDTLLEAIVLVIALIGVWSFAPDRAWGGRPGPRYQADPDGILAYLARLLPPLGIVIGIYLFWAGADHPGGKFQSATILAAMWMLVQMAGLADSPRTDQRRPARRHRDRAAGLRRGRRAGPVDGRGLSRLPGRLGQAADPGHRDRAAADAGAGAGAADERAAESWGRDERAGRSERSHRAPSAEVSERRDLFALTACALVGIGLYGLIAQPHPLRKLVAFNIMGSGVFVLFGALAKRGAAAGLLADPVPQALLITAIVVAFAATAVTVALLLRLIETTDSASLAEAPRRTRMKRPPRSLCSLPPGGWPVPRGGLRDWRRGFMRRVSCEARWSN